MKKTAIFVLLLTLIFSTTLPVFAQKSISDPNLPLSHKQWKHQYQTSCGLEQIELVTMSVFARRIYYDSPAYNFERKIEAVIYLTDKKENNTFMVVHVVGTKGGTDNLINLYIPTEKSFGKYWFKFVITDESTDELGMYLLSLTVQRFLEMNYNVAATLIDKCVKNNGNLEKFFEGILEDEPKN